MRANVSDIKHVRAAALKTQAVTLAHQQLLNY